MSVLAVVTSIFVILLKDHSPTAPVTVKVLNVQWHGHEVKTVMVKSDRYESSTLLIFHVSGSKDLDSLNNHLAVYAASGFHAIAVFVPETLPTAEVAGFYEYALSRVQDGKSHERSLFVVINTDKPDTALNLLDQMHQRAGTFKLQAVGIDFTRFAKNSYSIDSTAGFKGIKNTSVLLQYVDDSGEPSIGNSTNLVQELHWRKSPSAGLVAREFSRFFQKSGHSAKTSLEDRLGQFIDSSWHNNLARASLVAGARIKKWESHLLEFSSVDRPMAIKAFCCLSDNDLQSLDLKIFKHHIEHGLRVRRLFPWAAQAPDDIYVRYNLSGRFREEPVEMWRDKYLDNLNSHFEATLQLPNIKYEMDWLRVVKEIHLWVNFLKKNAISIRNLSFVHTKSPLRILNSSRNEMTYSDKSTLFEAAARSMGFCVRPVSTIWAGTGTKFYWSEIWNPNTSTWDPINSSIGISHIGPSRKWVEAEYRPVMHASCGNGSDWNARDEERWWHFENSLVNFLPAGKMIITVKSGGGESLAGIPVVAHVCSAGMWRSILEFKTDVFGKVEFFFPDKSRGYPFLISAGAKTGYAWASGDVDQGQRSEVLLVMKNPTNRLPTLVKLAKPIDRQ